MHTWDVATELNHFVYRGTKSVHCSHEHSKRVAVPLKKKTTSLQGKFHFNETLSNRLDLSKTMVNFLESHLHTNFLTYKRDHPYSTIRQTSYRYKYWRQYITVSELMNTQRKCHNALNKLNYTIFNSIKEARNISLEIVKTHWKPRQLLPCIL